MGILLLTQTVLKNILFSWIKVLCVGTTHQTLQKEVFVIDVAQVFFTKSKKVTDYQRKLAIDEDDILIKKIKSENIKIQTIDEKCLEEFKSVTNVFHKSYFQTYPHMKKYIKT